MAQYTVSERHEDEAGGWWATVTLDDGRKFQVLVDRGGRGWHGYVRDAEGREIFHGVAGPACGVHRVLVMAGLIRCEHRTGGQTKHCYTCGAHRGVNGKWIERERGNEMKSTKIMDLLTAIADAAGGLLMILPSFEAVRTEDDPRELAALEVEIERAKVDLANAIKRAAEEVQRNEGGTA